MTIRNRELSQFGSFIYIDNDTKDIGISTSSTPFVGIGTTNATSKFHVYGDTKLEGNVTLTGISTINGLLDINSGGQANTFKVEDLTENRVVIVGSGGELEDNTNLTFNGSQLTVGVDLDVDGQTELDDVNVSGAITATTFTGDLTGNAGTATALASARTFEITGDVVASVVSFDGTGNVSLAATIQPNSIGLGTDTTGNYVQSITGTANEIEVTNGTGEGSTPQIGLPDDVTIGGDLDVTGLTTTNNLYVSGISTFAGDITANDNIIISGNGNLDLRNSGAIRMGNNGDDNFLIYNNGNTSIINDNDPGNPNGLMISSGAKIELRKSSSSEKLAVFTPDSSVELYYDSVKKFETTSDGIDVTGLTTTNNLYVSGISTFSDDVTVDGNIIIPTNYHLKMTGGGDLDLTEGGILKMGSGGNTRFQIFNNGQVSVISNDDNNSGLLLRSTTEIKLQKNGSGNEKLAVFTPDSSVELYYDDVKKFETTSDGIDVTGLTTTNNLYVSGVSTFNGILNTNSSVSIGDSVNATAYYQNGSPLVDVEVQQWQDATGSDIYRPLGNVGIGTSTNLSKLSVNGQIESQATSGTAPFIVSSQTTVENLSAKFLDGKSAPSGSIIGTTDNQTLTNKTINLANNVLTGNTAAFNNALSDDDFVTLTNSVTLTNKTLTSPVISTITDGSSGSQDIPAGIGTLVSTSGVSIITSGMIKDGEIVNADVSASAAIDYSKLNLSNSIKDGDIGIGTIANNKLANSTISGISLGNNLSNLSKGTDVVYSSGTTYNGSSAITISVDSSTAATANKIVKRDSDGGINGNDITAGVGYTFYGDGSGITGITADLAVKIATANTSTTASFFPTFVDSNNTSSEYESLYTDNGISYNPSTGDLTVGGTMNATTFSGSGASLTSLNASSLGSGTIPDARFPATLPAISGANLTNITNALASQVTLTANNNTNETVYLTFADGVEGSQGLETDSGLTYNPSTNTLSSTAFANFDYLQAPFGSTVTFTVTVASKDASHRYNGTGSGNAYLINGVQAPFLTLTPGRTYRFTNNNTGSHPFKFYLEADKTTEYTSGVNFQNTYTEITVGDETPTVLHYQCTAHGYMGNAIQTNANVVNTNYPATIRSDLSVTGVSTFDSVNVGTAVTINASGMNINGIVTATSFVGDGSLLTNLPNGDSGSGGSGTFDTGITTSIYVSVGSGIGTAQAGLSTSQANNDIFIGPGIAYTFPATAGKSYVIESIQVTNIYNTHLYFTSRHDFDGGENIPTSQRVIIPYQGAVELLDQPIIANPSDILNFQAFAGVGTDATGVNNGLDSFIVYSEKTDTDYIGTGATITTTAGTELFTSTTNPSVLQSIRLCNYDLILDVDASVSIYRGGSVGGILTTGVRQGYLVYNLTIPKNSVVEILEKPKYLSVNDTIVVGVAGTNTANSLSATLSGKYIV